MYAHKYTHTNTVFIYTCYIFKVITRISINWRQDHETEGKKGANPVLMIHIGLLMKSKTCNKEDKEHKNCEASMNTKNMTSQCSL